jgi:uncharacterized protein (TIRG00374 family)
LRRGYQSVATRSGARVLLQALVSLGLLVLLVVVAQHAEVLKSLKDLQPGVLVFAAGLFVVACVFSSFRWQLLLRHLEVRERLGNLTALYFIGQFFSLFLPTSAGGDAVRIFEVARSSRRPVQAAVATLQERLLGLGTSLLIGLVATFCYLERLAPELRPWLILLQVGAVAGIALLVYPGLLFATASWAAKRSRLAQAGVRRFGGHRLGARLLRVLRQTAELPPLSPPLLVTVVGLAAITVLLNIAMYHVLGQALQIEIGFAAYCLVVPLVTIVRMCPLTLNGIGVGEGAFVFLMGLFGVAADKALALALTMLGLVTVIALAGGLVLAVRVARGTWVSTRQPTDELVEMPASPSEHALLDPQLAVGEKVL